MPPPYFCKCYQAPSRHLRCFKRKSFANLGRSNSQFSVSKCGAPSLPPTQGAARAARPPTLPPGACSPRPPTVRARPGRPSPTKTATAPEAGHHRASGREEVGGGTQQPHRPICDRSERAAGRKANRVPAREEIGHQETCGCLRPLLPPPLPHILPCFEPPTPGPARLPAPGVGGPSAG